MTHEAVLREYFTQEVLPGGTAVHLEADEDLIESGVLDSLALVQLISFLEKRFRIPVLPHEVCKENFGSLDRLARFIEGRTGGR